MARIVITSQVYVPDPASVGQHLHDLAVDLAARGHDVRVYCSSRGYDDPTRRYPLRENLDGVSIKRYRLPIFKKGNLLLRVFGSAWAMIALFFMTLFTPRLGLVVFTTSPPLSGFVVTLACMIRRVPRVYWAMDLNPDQLVALGKTTERSLVFRALESVNQFIVNRATLSVPLDRFMDERLRLFKRRPKKTIVLPPWSHEDVDEPIPHEANWFRDKHNLQGKFVVMYSGNHTPANPLDTLLEAVLRLRDDASIVFAFVGGGAGKAQVKKLIADHKLTNCLELPYQPMSDLRYSLGAADVHVVSLGPAMRGIVHPCKVYGSMAVARPVLYFGPRPSHVTDYLDAADFGQAVSHGDTDAAVAAIKTLQSKLPEERAAMGARAQALLARELSHEIVSGKLCDAIEAEL